MKTIYGDLDDLSLKLYYRNLKNRTFALLPLYEEQPFETYQKYLQDLLVGVISLEQIKLEKTANFVKYIELLASIKDPKPLEKEDEHSFVRRYILDAVNLLERMFNEIETNRDTVKISQAEVLTDGKI